MKEKWDYTEYRKKRDELIEKFIKTCADYGLCVWESYDVLQEAAKSVRKTSNGELMSTLLSTQRIEKPL